MSLKIYIFACFLVNNLKRNMRKAFLLLVGMMVLAFASTSCVTSKSVRYLKDLPKDGMPLNESFEATIAPYDELRIYLIYNGEDKKLLEPFNVMGDLGNNAGVQQGYGYLVDVNGNIQFPALGELHVAGLTRLQLQDTICAQLKSKGYLNRPMVMVRCTNFKVFFLSSSGGKVININNERCTFLEALAMAGGVDFYTRRDRIGVMRDVEGKMVIHYLDPRSTSIFDDEFFLLQQNDIIFTEETHYGFFRENFTIWMTFVSAITSLASLFLMYKSIEALTKP